MGVAVLKRRDIIVKIVDADNQRNIEIEQPSQKVRSVIQEAMKKSGITDGKAFMSGLVATALKSVVIEDASDQEIKRRIGKAVAETLNETVAQ